MTQVGLEVRRSSHRSFGRSGRTVRACLRGYVKRVLVDSNCRAARLRTEKDRAFIRFYQNSMTRVQVGGELELSRWVRTVLWGRPVGVALD